MTEFTVASATELILDLLHFECGSNGSWIKGNAQYVSGVPASAADVEVLPGEIMPRTAKKARRSRSQQSALNIPYTVLRDIRTLCEETGYSDALPLFSSFAPLRVKIENTAWQEAVDSVRGAITVPEENIKTTIKIEFR